MDIDYLQVINQLFSSGLTACFTILGGLTIMVIGQLVMKLFAEPIIEQDKLITEVAKAITFYANLFGNGELIQEKERITEASRNLRTLASQLRASAQTIHWYPFWSFLRLVRKKRDLMEASAGLIGLSNSMFATNPSVIIDHQRRIQNALGLTQE